VKRLKRKTKQKSRKPAKEVRGSSQKSPSTSRSSKSQEKEAEDDEASPEHEDHIRTIPEPINDESLWKKTNEVELKGRDEEFDDYLADLLL
jgi:hypothetical protein